MRIILDSNIAFSALVNSRSAIAEIIIGYRKEFQFYTSEYMLTELNKHHDKLKKASGLNDEEIDIAKYQLFKYINFITLDIIPEKFWLQAEQLIYEVDPDDIAFVALSLYLKAYLWTGDKKLYNCLKAKKMDNVISTIELQNLIVKK